jgi:uncharacterized MAPEG superfamily protein
MRRADDPTRRGRCVEKKRYDALEESMMLRRRFLRLAGAAAMLPAVPRNAKAETYPARAVHVIVGQAAGSSSDIVTRLIGQWLSERFNQQCLPLRQALLQFHA